MPSQIFKEHIPIEYLMTFLQKNCENRSHTFIFDHAAFKRSKLNESIRNFLDNIRPYYFSAKQVYIDRKLHYSSFCTIIRQICKYNNVGYSTHMVYNRSDYEIIYHIVDQN